MSTAAQALGGPAIGVVAKATRRRFTLEKCGSTHPRSWNPRRSQRIPSHPTACLRRRLSPSLLSIAARS
jgi:hypothetical protein